MLVDPLMTAIFGQIPGMLSLTAFSVFIILVLNIPYKFLLDNTYVSNIKEDQKKIGERIKKAQKDGNTQKTSDLLSESLELNNKLMKMMIKPMIVSLLIVIFVLTWAQVFYADLAVRLPLSLPIFGNQLGWIGWYMVVSVPTLIISRRLMGINL